MYAPLLDAKIASYKHKILKLDTLAQKLSTKDRTKYKAARRRFEQRLKAWRQTLGSDLAAFESNVDEGYYELEAHLTSSAKR